MSGATHNPNITTTVYLSSLTVAGATFGVVMLLVPKASNSLNGARVMTFTTYAEAESARGDGYISAATLLAAEAAFAQPKAPIAFKVGNVDLAGSETYATGLDAVIAADPDFYGVCITPRTDTEIALIAAKMTTLAADGVRRLFFFQSDDSAILTGTPPSGLSAVVDNERAVGVYHSSDSEWAELAWAVNRLLADPDEISTPWNGCRVWGIDSITAITATQRNYLVANNYNVGLPLGTITYAMDPGVNMAGRDISELLAADWFSARLHERVSKMQTDRAALHQKIPVNATGLALLEACAANQAELGVNAGHFSGYSVSPKAVTEADVTARRLRVDVACTVVRSGRILTFNTYFSA